MPVPDWLDVTCSQGALDEAIQGQPADVVRLAADIVPGQPFLGEELFDHPLTGDSRMIGARQPERLSAARGLEEGSGAAQHVRGAADGAVHGDVRRT